MQLRFNKYRRLLLKTLLLTFFAFAFAPAAWPADAPRPNILWITSEDNGPHLGCYGDEYADTPNLDALADKGLVYLHCWSNAPVCAPARTTIITGVYPPALGAEHMRSQVALPDFMQMYPQLLRKEGYYCTNNSKEDYNVIKPGKVWDDSSRKAHWKNRQPGQPFFAIFNHTVSHESQIRKRPHKPVHDPKKVRVPAYHPDTEEVRQDWAQYYDKLTEMDAKAGENLQELEDAGLADDTIVFYYGDHGSGMPRGKRWPYNSGLHVPLIVHIPEKFASLRPDDYKAGGKTDRLVSFVDLAPTLLSLIGVEPPDWMQGSAFLGKRAAAPQPYLYGFRGRMDERYDLVRSVRNERYVYIRNYMPHKIYGQHIAYMFQTPTTRVWKERFDRGLLDDAQSAFWQPKPPEELYDLKNDPDEVNNLVASPEHRKALVELREAHLDHAMKIKDIGFLPEDEIHRRSNGITSYELGHGKLQDSLPYIIRTADLASSLRSDATPELVSRLDDEENAVRYWAAMGLMMRGDDTVERERASLIKLLSDECPSVRVAAAEALAKHCEDDVRKQSLELLVASADLKENSLYVAMQAMNALDQLDEKALPVKEAIEKLPKRDPSVPGRLSSYVSNLITKTLQDLK